MRSVFTLSLHIISSPTPPCSSFSGVIPWLCSSLSENHLTQNSVMWSVFLLVVQAEATPPLTQSIHTPYSVWTLVSQKKVVPGLCGAC